MSDEKVLITEEQIFKKAKEIGAEITEDFQGKDIILVGILKGSVMWMADLMKRIDLDLAIDFMAISSYGDEKQSSGVVKIIKDIDIAIEDKDVIIVEDIVDSGTTLAYLKSYLKNMNPKSISICTLLDKPEGRKTPVDIDYKGFEVEDVFIVGCGLDYAQKYRNLPYIKEL